jgi:Tfp pilus tip-associated adhesin PilY1
MDIAPNYYTFVNLATSGGTNSSPGVLGGNPVNAASLVDAFKAAIQSALFDSYSAVAPTIMQKTSTNALILVPDFQYKATTQWPGHLTASTINADGSISSTAAWEFGANLNNVSPNARYIWTAAPNVPVNTSSTPNNFITSNLTYLSSAMGDSTSLTTQLINFIRGYDAFDENANGSFTDTRWKLNDIYNSKPVYVAQPEQTITTDPNFAGGKEYFYKLNPSAYTTFLNNTKNRKAMVYVGSNAGVLHAIDADTGNESWAFVPPPLLDKLDNVVSILPNSTNSIYGVDGSAVAQDVYINGQWKTYLAITLGMGARGYSVLDVTNPAIPIHVFSIERYQDINGNESTRWWTSNGTLNTNNNVPGLDNIYQTLGNTTSTPVFSYAKSHNGAYSPVLVLGQGTSNNGLTNVKIYLGANPTTSSVGSGALIVGLVPGQEGMLIHDKDVGYTSTGDGQTAVTSITPIQTTTAVTNSYSIQITNTYALDEGASVTGGGIPANSYVVSVDSSTQVTLNNRATLPAGTTLTFTRRIFNEVMTQVDILESGSTPFMQTKYGYRMLIPNNNGYIHSFSDIGTDASTIGYPYSSFSSTAPNGAYGAFHVMNSGTTFYNDRLIQQPLSISNYVASTSNQLNVVYGTGDMETLSMIDKSPDNLIVSIQDTENNIFGLNKSRSFLTTNSSSWGSSSLFMDATNTYSPTCQSSSQQGWYVRMNGLTAADENNVIRSCQSAKLAAKTETYGGMVAAPIYIPPADLNSCALGSSALIYRDAKCGYQSAPPLYLSSMLIGGITTFKKNIYISVSSKSAVTKVDAANKYSKVGAVITGQPGFTLKPVTLKSKLRIR